MKLLLNGAMVDGQQAVVSVYDHGFLYGMGLFETFRTYGGMPFLLERHLRRLAEGCKLLGIEYIPDEAKLREQIAELLEANKLEDEDAYIRLTVSAGPEALGLPTGDYTSPNVVIYMKELPPRNAEAYLKGKSLQLLRTPRNTPESDIRLKSFHYMNNIGAKRELLGYPWAQGAEGLFLDGRGFAAEGIVSNLFLIRNDVCCTPHLDTGILPGITRMYVMELAAVLGLPVEEGWYSWDDVKTSDELFVTNSIQELVPISCCYDQQGTQTLIGNMYGGAGHWTHKLIEQYNRATGSIRG